MTPRKLNRAFALAGITLPSVRAHIERNLAAVAADLQDATTKQLAAIVALHHAAYTQGKSSCAAEVDGDAVWIGVGIDKLVPLDALRKIEVTEDVRSVETPHTSTVYPPCSDLYNSSTKKYVSREEFFRSRDCNAAANYVTRSQIRTVQYKMDHTERT